CAFLPSRSTATAVVIRARVTGRQRSKVRRASVIPSGTGARSSARTSRPPYAEAWSVSGDHGPTAHSVGTSASPSRTNSASSATAQALERLVHGGDAVPVGERGSQLGLWCGGGDPLERRRRQLRGRERS